MLARPFIVWLTATAFAAVATIASHVPARADPAAHGWREVWGGADASAHVWLIYSGMTVAPHSDIFSDGLRLRVAGGYGGYTYVGARRGELVSFTAGRPLAKPSSAT
jgi:hypothetical protein